MGKSVLVIGSACVDVIIHVDHLPKTEENLHPSSQTFRVGGCAYNVANILGRGGADTLFVTPVGLRGVFGPFVLPVLEKQPWARPVKLQNRENGCCYCLVEPSGERTFLSIHGAEYAFSPSWMALYAGRSFDYTYVCGLEAEETTGDTLVSWLENRRQGTLLYAPGPRGMRVPPERTDRLMALGPMLHLNRTEALQMGGAENLYAAMENLHRKTGQAVIVTLGPEGAVLLHERKTETLPGCSVDRVADTIGAGDAHAGAVLLGLSRGWTLPDAVRFANRVAAQVVMQEGATLEEDGILRE